MLMGSMSPTRSRKFVPTWASKPSANGPTRQFCALPLRYLAYSPSSHCGRTIYPSRKCSGRGPPPGIQKLRLLSATQSPRFADSSAPKTLSTEASVLASLAALTAVSVPNPVRARSSETYLRFNQWRWNSAGLCRAEGQLQIIVADLNISGPLRPANHLRQLRHVPGWRWRTASMRPGGGPLWNLGGSVQLLPRSDQIMPLREVVWVILVHFRMAVFFCRCRCGHVGNALALSIMSTAIVTGRQARCVA
jgi:hypothetical protein